MTTPPRDPSEDHEEADWPEGESPTEEERRLAARLARHIDSSLPQMAGATFDESDAIHEDLLLQATLLKGNTSFELSPERQRFGREEVIRFATQRASSAKIRPSSQSLWKKWLVWAPLPAIALLALAGGLRGVSTHESSQIADGSASESRLDTEEASPSPAQAHEPLADDARKATEAHIVSVQATWLAARVKGAVPPSTTENLDAAMRGYRADLLARLERAP